MNIGYVHRDKWPPNSGDSVYSWEIFSRLLRQHTVYVEETSPFPGGIKAYRNVWDCAHFARKIDILFINIEGYFNFHVEKFVLLKFFNPKLKIVLFTQAPIEESLLFGKSQIRVTAEKIMRIFFGLFVDANICVSENMRSYCVSKLRIAHSYTIPNGADPAVFHPHVRPVPYLHDMKRIYKVFWTGPSEFPWQGLDTLLEVAKAMKKIDSHIMFFVVTSCIPPTSDYQIDNIVWLHTVDQEDLPRYLVSADICLCLYHELLPHIGFYNSSIKLFSYMSMAKPIIASSLGQIISVITHTKNGLLTDGSVVDIIKKIRTLKKNIKYANRLGRQARNDVLRYYNWDRVSDEIDSIVRSIVK
jgi:glycosyltransferase involved in cell wall biosynthesis